MDDQIAFLMWLMMTTQLSQADLARKLGISTSLMSRLLRGERRLTLPLLRHIAEVFEMPQTEVFERAGVLQTETAPVMAAVIYEDAGEADQVAALQKQLEDLRDPAKALAWSLQGRLPERTIEKLQHMVELELKYQDVPKEEG